MANPEWDNYNPYPKMKGELVYLASPYSHKDKAVMEERFRKVNKVAAKLMATGIYVFAPISHTHPIALEGELPKGWDFWEGYDTAMISRCTSLIVVMLEGWDKSVGVQAEIKIAKNYELPVSYVTEDGYWYNTEYDYTKANAV
jgi:hypothetical protein